MIRNLSLKPFLQTSGGSSGIRRRRNSVAASSSASVASTAITDANMVRGVPQSQIDQLKVTRDHQATMTWETVRDDYARVGISITEQEARDIATAVEHYTFLHDTDMRKAMNLANAGREHDLTPTQQKELAEYRLIAEYCRVAPTLPYGSHKTVYRGIKNSTLTPEYSQALYDLKVGDTWDVDRMPTSFSTDKATAKAFSHYKGTKGIVIHMPTSTLKNSPSMRGLSHFASENEVFVTDYNWKVKRIADRRTRGDGYYHIYLDR